MDSLDANIMDKSMRSVFVGNIPYEATEEKLKDIFGEVGQVLSFKLVFDRETGKPKGYGFCEYRDQETALSAMRNLNGYEIGGRNLRVDNACTEKSRMEMQNLLNQPPIENPYGEPIQADKAPEAISKAVASLPPEQMFELMKQMKICIQNNPTEAKNMLLQNPQLTYALLQAQVVMRIIDPQTACSMLHSTNLQSLNLMPNDKPISGPIPITNFAMNATAIRQEFINLHGNQSSSVFGADRNADVDLRPHQQEMANRGGSDPRMRVMSGGGDRVSDRDRDSRGNDRDRDNRGGMSGPDRERSNDQDMRSAPNPLPNPVPPPLMDTFARDPRGNIGYNDPRQQRSDPRQKNIPPPVVQNPNPVQIPQTRPMPVPAPRQPPAAMPAINPGMSPNIGPSGASDQEKAALIMQVLQLSDEQIAMLPPEQRNSILVLKEQIAKSTQR